MLDDDGLKKLGDAILLDANAHIYCYEAGAPAALAGVQVSLLDGARAEAKQNSSWQVRRPARFALLREHIDQVRAHEQTPLGEDDEVVESGRRLAEREPPSPPPLTPMQQMMKEATNKTCYELALKNATGAHDAHVQSTHLWMYLEGGGNDRRGQGRICVDCQFPNYTTSCRQHMAHVGRALLKLRFDAEKPREMPYAEKKRRMVEKVKDHMDEMCCAELRRFCRLPWRQLSWRLERGLDAPRWL